MSLSYWTLKREAYKSLPYKITFAGVALQNGQYRIEFFMPSKDRQAYMKRRPEQGLKELGSKVYNYLDNQQFSQMKSQGVLMDGIIENEL